MKRLIIFVLMALVGLSFCFQNVSADSARTISHKFTAYSVDTAVAQGRTIFRITGATSAANGVFGIYNAATTEAAVNANCAIEGGEATSADALPHYYFGPEGISLDAGATVLVENCVVVIEYI